MAHKAGTIMSNIHLEQAGEFFRRFFRMGATLKMALKLLTDDALMQWWIDQLKGHAEFKLVHGMYNPATDVLEAFKARCSDKGIDFGKFTWIGAEISPFEFTDDSEVVVVLDATIDTLQATCEFAWEWAKDGQDDSWRWEGMLSDADKLRLLEGSEPFVPYTLRWRRIKLNTNIGKKPEDVRDCKKSPGLAGLFAAAEHPARIKATDYKTRFGYWLAGLECTAPDKDAWRRVPYVHFNRGHRQVSFGSDRRDGSGSDLPVPTFWEN